MTAEDLSSIIATAAPGAMDKLKGTVAWLPFVSAPEPRLFEASELQKDRERLHRYYRRQGFLDALVDYQVRLSKNRRDVSVAFAIQEGRPLTIQRIAPLDSIGGVRFRAPSDLIGFGEKFWKRLDKDFVGDRFSEKRVDDLRQRVAEAMADRGYARSSVTPRARIDSAGARRGSRDARRPGPASSHRGVDVRGVHSVPTEQAARQIDVSEGDWYSRTAIVKGRANLQSVPLFARSEVVVTDSAAADSGIVVEAHVTGVPSPTHNPRGRVRHRWRRHHRADRMDALQFHRRRSQSGCVAPDPDRVVDDERRSRQARARHRHRSPSPTCSHPWSR